MVVECRDEFSRKMTREGAMAIETGGQQASRGQFDFTGSGSEYFRIWIVNLVLTILTLGIYSAWAKVRRLQYFYRNTSLFDSTFDYHGNPIAILKGRLLAVGLLVAYNVTAAISPVLGLVVFAGLLGVLPLLLQRSICFKLHNSSYRGIRFRFLGTVAEAYKVFLGWVALGYVTLGLLFPFAHQRIKAYQHNNAAYGTTSFNFDARVGSFYALYGKLILLVLLPAILFGVAMAGLGVFTAFKAENAQQAQQVAGVMILGLVVFYLALYLLIGPWFAARSQNLVWNHTGLAEHRFVSSARARDLLVLYVTNFVLIIITVGLFKPFADIRLARYRLSRMALDVAGGIDQFVAQQQQAISAAGEETADVFDVDISF